MSDVFPNLHALEIDEWKDPASPKHPFWKGTALYLSTEPLLRALPSSNQPLLEDERLVSNSSPSRQQVRLDHSVTFDDELTCPQKSCLFDI